MSTPIEHQDMNHLRHHLHKALRNQEPSLSQLLTAITSAAAQSTLHRPGPSLSTESYLRSLFDLTGRVAFVTGCSRGIGKQACLALARAGADVMVTDYSENELQKCQDVSKEIRDMGRMSYSAICDVRHQGSVTDCVQQCKEDLGGPCILLANAGILGDVNLPENLEESDWRNIFATNTDGVFHCCRAVFPIFREQKRGKVIIMSSIASMVGYDHQAAFSSSKGAVIPLAKALAVAWAKYNIQVNCLVPGIVNTEFVGPMLDSDLQKYVERIPTGRLADPEDLLGAILFFASKASDYCTGSQLVVDGGLSSNVLGS